MEPTEITVVKVGGSLLPWVEFPGRLRAYLDSMNTQRQVLLVGGGKPADFIRELDSTHGIGEKRSHRLALRSLDLTAYVVNDLVKGLAVVEQPGAFAEVWENGLIPILAPRWLMENLDGQSQDPLPETWTVTSDSIAARIASLVGAKALSLLKSTGLDGKISRRKAADAGIVDPAFPEASSPLHRVAVVNLRANPPTTEYFKD